MGSPWILYQVWAFIAPGLYRRERRWAAPFVLATAGLFLAGACFAYFLVLPFGLVFLLGIGISVAVDPMISVDVYFSRFVNVMLGVSLVFELPLVILFLTLLRLASPRFLLTNSRYALLAIVIVAAIVTPTQDVVNLALLAAPMAALYFAGVFASYLLVMKREGRRIRWVKCALWTALALLIAAGLFWGIHHYRH